MSQKNTPKRIYVHTEYHEGEYELRGEKYHTMDIFDLDVLDRLSKEKIEGGLKKEWEEKLGEEIEPINDKEFSFEDILEEICCGEYDNISGYYKGEEEAWTLELDKVSQEDLDRLSKEQNRADHYDSTMLVENVLSEFFTDEEIESFLITKDVKIKSVHAIFFE